MSLIDYEAVVQRHVEKKALKVIRQQIIEKHKSEEALLQKKFQEQRRILEEKQQNYLKEKKHQQEIILQKSEQHALQEEQKIERELEALRTQTRHAVRSIVFQGISKCQEVFRDKYTTVHKLLLACTEIANKDHNKCLKDLIEQFEQLIGKIKANEYGPTELRTAQCICEAIEVLELKIIAELEDFIEKSKEKAAESFQRLAVEEAERKQQAELEQQRQQKEEEQQQRQQKEQEQQQQQLQATELQNVAAVETEKVAVSTVPQNIVSVEQQTLTNLEQEQLNAYNKVIDYYQQTVDKVNNLKNDDSLKKYRFACQKAINTPINAISAVSPQHLQDKFAKLYGFINGQPSNDVRVTDHPLGREYCLLLIAKRFVSQGSTTVSSHPQAAFPIATILVSLWKLIPELGHLFLAYLYKESPYMVPCFLRQQAGQSREEFLKQLGYHFTNNEIEASDMYLKRQAGIARLYAAVMITSGRQADGPTHPHGLSNAWCWLTKFIALGPLPDLSATIINEFLQITGFPLLTCYGKQFIKLLVYIQHVYFLQLSAIDKGGPRARLELQLNKFLKEGRVEKPQGMLEAGYW